MDFPRDSGFAVQLASPPVLSWWILCGGELLFAELNSVYPERGQT